MFYDLEITGSNNISTTDQGGLATFSLNPPALLCGNKDQKSAVNLITDIISIIRLIDFPHISYMKSFGNTKDWTRDPLHTKLTLYPCAMIHPVTHVKFIFVSIVDLLH